MANKPGTANFFPDVPAYPEMGTFQPVYGKFDLTTYIQGASDYEIMAFLVGKYNACLEAYDKVTKLSTDTITAAHQLQDWINTWFDNLDVQQELNNKIDSMVADGSFGTLLHQTFDTQINQQTTSAVTAWLVANVTPTGSAVVVDKSLSIEGAAADAKVVGEVTLNKTMPTVPNNTDLNDFTHLGMSYLSSDNTYTNSPTISGLLLNYNIGTIATVRHNQVIYDSITDKIYYRRYKPVEKIWTEWAFTGAIDTTLSLSGYAADAQKTGEANIELKNSIADVSQNVNSIAALYKKVTKTLAFSELNSYAGYLSANGREVVASNNYATFTLPALSYDSNALIKVLGNAETYGIFRAFITDIDAIISTANTALPIEITDSAKLSAEIPSNKYLCFTTKKQSVDTIEYVFSKLTVENESAITIPSLQPTDVQVNKYLSLYNVNLNNGLLTVSGNDIECTFSDKTFSGTNGLFELQNLNYKNELIFSEENDFIGSIKIANGEIIGGKHGSEVTDSINIVTDTGTLSDGQKSTTKCLNIYVTSHIENVANRISIYSFNGKTLLTSSYIKVTNDNTFNRIWCCGLLSVDDNTALHWLSKKEMTESLEGTNEILDKCTVVCNKFNLFSNMIWIDSPVGNKGREFIAYTGRKKYYNYNVYGNQAVSAGTVFSSCNELKFR